MFKYIKTLLGDDAVAEVPAAVPDAAPPPAPVAEPAAGRKDSFVCREAVLARSQRIAGYEFSLPQGVRQRLEGEGGALRRAYDDVLLRHLGALGGESLLGSRLAFVALSSASLGHPELLRLPVENLVVTLDAVEAASDAAATEPQVAALRARGLRLNWRWQPAADASSGFWLPLADFVEIDIGGFDGLLLRRRIAEFKQAGTRHARQVIAGGVDSFDEFNFCYQAGCDFFRGPFVSTREAWKPRPSEVNRVRVMQLLNDFRAGAETTRLAAEIRQDPVLTFKLLRFINSAAFGLQKEVTSIEQALVLLGRETFYRWLSLLIFDFKDPGYAEWLLIEQALTRGRLMELLAAEQGRRDGNDLFLTGLFSLLDRLLGRPLPEALAELTLPQPIRAALLYDEGDYAPFLRLALACEQRDGHGLDAATAACGTDPEALGRHMLSALTWANELTQPGNR
jgi:EAL and modified HD-GYP domain-containing signal transduction protein